MEFKQFSTRLKQHVASMSEDEKHLFEVDITPDEVWEAYLESFPPGTNEIFRERRDHDCSCCRQFIRSIGNVVAVKDLEYVTIWDFETEDPTYKAVIEALDALIRSKPIKDVFMPVTRKYGTVKSLEARPDAAVHTWYHLNAVVSDSVKVFKEDQVGSVRGRMRDARNVLKRSFEEISIDSVDTVLDLIAQKSLYKGEEWNPPLKLFRAMHQRYKDLANGNLVAGEVDRHEVYCWTASLAAGEAISKIKNHSIGVLLTDISDGKDLNEAVKRYEKIVAPSNYKRPRAIFTKRMVEMAKTKMEELGLLDSFGRRHARIDDITVNNILFANRDTARKMAGDVFEELSESLPDKPQSFDRIEEVPIDVFVKDVLPTAEDMEVLLENRHSPNMVSLIAPKVKDCKPLFKWSNNFSWAYSGNITDSMKQRVKAAGGDVDGELRFSIQWNDNGDNLDDLDAHCHEPGRIGAHIYFQNKGSRHRSSGMLDVDITQPDNPSQTSDGVAVENITWIDRSKMPKGKYQLLVHNYHARGARSGFSAEVEFDGRIFSFSYDKPLRHNEKVNVAEVTFDGKDFSIKKLLSAQESSKEIWGITTQKFIPVSACMYSPNYWDGQKGIGHRHYFFLLKGCKNEESPNGFFNEFLKEELMEHRHVFEALGSKMRVENSDDQLSGLGFSATKRAALVVRVKGSFSRVLRLKF